MGGFQNPTGFVTGGRFDFFPRRFLESGGYKKLSASAAYQNRAYINGAIAEPSTKTIKAAISSRKMMMGTSHHFLLTLRKSQNSTNMDSLDIDGPSVIFY
jgi:hypothetical protein